MRRFQSIGVLLSIITGLLVLVLVSVFANSAREAYDRRQAATGMLASVRTIRDAYAMAEILHIEDGRMRMLLVAPAPVSVADRGQLEKLHARAGKSVDQMLADIGPKSKARPDVDQLRRGREDYERLFSRGMDALGRSGKERDQAVGQGLATTINGLTRLSQKQADEGMAALSTADSLTREMMKIVRISQQVRQVAGIGRRMVGQAIASGEAPGDTMLHDLAELDGRFNSPWAVMDADARSLSSPVFPQQLRDALTTADRLYVHDTLPQRDAILSQLSQGRRVVTGAGWMQISDRGLNALARVSATALNLTDSHIAGELKVADREFSLALLMMFVSISMASLTALFVNFRVIMPLRSIVGAMSRVANGELNRAIPYTDRHDEIGEFARALCLFRDGTLEKQSLQEELHQVRVARESAEAASRIKSEFLANMSHELRTPLNAILGFSDMMKNEISGPMAAQYREYAGLIHESGDHLLNLVSDLLDIAKIEAGKFVVSYEAVELTEALDYCTRMLRRRAQEKGVVLALDVPPGPINFSADPRGFRQIVINLLSNAVKFTRRGGRIGLSASVEGGELKIVISDSGIGMSESLLARIGRPFEQASNDPSHAREGTGLGLSLVRAIVIQHRGTLAIQSREHVGTTVTVCLPLAREARAAVAA